MGGPIKSAVASHLGAERRLEEIKSEKSTAQTALTNYTANTMSARQTAVNDLLADFGANFRIVDTKTIFVGRDPNTEFAIEIGPIRSRLRITEQDRVVVGDIGGRAERWAAGQVVRRGRP